MWGRGVVLEAPARATAQGHRRQRLTRRCSTRVNGSGWVARGVWWARVLMMWGRVVVLGAVRLRLAPVPAPAVAAAVAVVVVVVAAAVAAAVAVAGVGSPREIGAAR